MALFAKLFGRGPQRPDSERFFVAPFTPDGQLEGVGAWKVADLSPKWLAVCSGLLKEYGESFRASLGGPLEHIELKLTSADRSALLTAYVHGHVTTSAVLLGGGDSAAESELIEMFHGSLQHAPVVEAIAAGRKGMAFGKLRELRERPLLAVVVWGNAEVSEEDHELVAELQNHLAGAYFFRPPSRFE